MANYPGDEQDRFVGDAYYEAWRRGLDPDRVDWDRVCQDFYDGRESSAEADRLERLELLRRQEQQEREAQEQYEMELEAQYQEELRRQEEDGDRG